MASRLMLQCYVKLPEYIDEALESMRAEWIIRDDFFVRQNDRSAELIIADGGHYLLLEHLDQGFHLHTS